MRRQNPKKRIQRAKYWVLTFNLNIQATKRWIQAAFEQQKQFPSRNQFPSPFHVRYQGFEKIFFFSGSSKHPPDPRNSYQNARASFSAADYPSIYLRKLSHANLIAFIMMAPQ